MPDATVAASVKKDGRSSSRPSELTKMFGGLTAVESLDLRVHRGEISSLIGPNGAGKTTVFNVVTGIYRSGARYRWFQGADITGIKPHRIVEQGVARTFQNIRLFANLTCLENVIGGRHCRTTFGSGRGGLSSARRQVAEERGSLEGAEDRLEQVGLWEVRDELGSQHPVRPAADAGDRPGPRNAPRLLVLDEPVSGLNPMETEDLMGSSGASSATSISPCS